MSEAAATYRSAPALIVGLDPGEQTGVAAYDPRARRLKYVFSLGFWMVVSMFETELGPEQPADGSAPGPVVLVVIEDARKLPVYGRHDKVRGRRRDRLARNIGRIDRDTQLWVEYLERRGYRVLLARPSREQKWDAATFKRITRYQGRTNQHARDAGMLVFALKAPPPESFGQATLGGCAGPQRTD
ncbi:MAG: hypothetical protein ACE10K_07210 [Rhodothermales bacterium]